MSGRLERLPDLLLPARGPPLERRLELLADAVLVRRPRLRLRQPRAQAVDLGGELRRVRRVRRRARAQPRQLGGELLMLRLEGGAGRLRPPRALERLPHLVLSARRAPLERPSSCSRSRCSCAAPASASASRARRRSTSTQLRRVRLVGSTARAQPCQLAGQPLVLGGESSSGCFRLPSPLERLAQALLAARRAALERRLQLLGARCSCAAPASASASWARSRSTSAVSSWIRLCSPGTVPRARKSSECRRACSC